MDANISTRIDMAIAYLKTNRLIRFQKEVAERMNVDVNTVSRAKNGGDYNPENFAMRFNAAFGFIFSTKWLLYGTGEMLAEKEKSTINHEPVRHSENSQTLATVPESSGSVCPSDIPAWADSLINLFSQNTAIIQDLHVENAQLRDAMIAVIEDNKKLRKELAASLALMKHKQIIYEQEENILPMAAEAQPSNNK